MNNYNINITLSYKKLDDMIYHSNEYFNNATQIAIKKILSLQDLLKIFNRR